MTAKDGRMKVLVMCLADPSVNPRPNRIIKMLLKQGHQVDVLSHATSHDIGVKNQFVIDCIKMDFISRTFRFLLGSLCSIFITIPFFGERLALYFNRIRHNIPAPSDFKVSSDYEVLVVEDLYLLPFAFLIKGSGKIFFDAREFYPLQNEDKFHFMIFEAPFRRYLCKSFLKKCDLVATVSPGLVDAYKKYFNVDAVLFRSVPFYWGAVVRPTDGESIRIVHHGVANKNRKIEDMIEVVKRLESRYSIDFYLVGSPHYINKLKQQAAGCDRINFMEPMTFENIIPNLYNYDIGFFFNIPKTFNLLHCLPNKFFEYVQAKLVVATGPSPDMASLIKMYEFGLVSSEFSVNSMVSALNNLTADDINKLKENSATAAHDLCFEKEFEKVTKILCR